MAQTTLRSVLGQVELDELLTEREKINRQLQGILDEHTDPWGIKVSAVEVKHVDLPQEMQRAIARQAEAERERRAKIIHADGEYQAAETLRRAAEANVNYFEATVVDEYARRWGVHPDRMRQAFLDFDVQYLLTVASRRGVQMLAGQMADPKHQARLVLGNNVSNFALSSSLVAKYYSLGAELDENGNVTSIARERALADMLDLADQRARELIALNGEEAPVIAILYYETARLQRQGGPADQMDALRSYWMAAMLAQVQAYLAGVVGG